MNLLIVDDESHVREGIIHRIDWKALGIDGIESARNGREALDISRSFAPDIVLTDVRMPRLSGTDMAFALRKSYPKCSIIFMSGYSDKQYLKDAICLKAVSYIEKPAEMEDLIQALQEAVDTQKQYAASVKQAAEQSQKLTLSMKAYENELLLSMTRKGFDYDAKSDILQKIFPGFETAHTYIVCIIELLPAEGVAVPGASDSPDSAAPGASDSPDTVRRILGDYFTSRGSALYIAKKEGRYLVCFFSLGPYGQKKEAIRQHLAEEVDNLLEPRCRFIASFGNIVPDAASIHISYNNATAAMLSSFYYGCNCVILYREETGSGFAFSEEQNANFHELLTLGDYDLAAGFVIGLIRKIRLLPNTFIYTVKNFFCELYVDLYRTAKAAHISSIPTDANEDSLRKHLYSMRFLSQIETEITEKLRLYYTEYHAGNAKNVLSNKVKYYVHTHYGEPDLSLATIAPHFDMSGAYLCNIFRKEEGVTLTHYITAYRIDKAKELLADPRIKVKDVALTTGYNDCNYFIKIFKKREHMTPVEYRKAMEK